MDFPNAEALAEEDRDHLAVTGGSSLDFDAGNARFDPV